MMQIAEIDLDQLKMSLEVTKLQQSSYFNPKVTLYNL